MTATGAPTPRASYMTDRVGPLPFCPGCGHTPLLKALDKALVKLQLPPERVVLVTDIGCIGMAERYFDVHGFHGLHGRSITYACGLKLARPDLTVIALKGDGGCGIGGTHLLNVARRNIGITLIVADNFNYGMTGGQHSVTTPTGGLTSTTPLGNLEAPMDLCRTAAAAGAAWVHRSTIFEKDLPDVLAEAIRQDGFAMVDVAELCTAYYAARNQVKKQELYDLLARYELQLGRIADKPRPEYSAQYRASYAETAGKPIRVKGIQAAGGHRTARQTGIVIAGAAGQKIKSTATLFGQAAMMAGLEATQKDDYPITVQTGHSLAELIVSPQPIEYTGIEVPDYLLVLSAEGLAKVARQLAALPASSTVLIDAALTPPPTAARVLALPLAATAKAIDKLVVAVIGLAALLAHSQLFEPAVLGQAISAFQKPALAEPNRKAVAAGAALIHAPDSRAALGG